ncbi:NitT/TauT family transport system substrate-binding protein [Epsilonproteobacteria bacterium SCGC AD-308-O04]|nr:NitT/TauT family transport system substrate-binding protein [Epsilonproteobacteria bacterium SCGC AD-308-O04]
MYKKLLLIFITMFSLTSCSSPQNEKLKISATTWIGYSPLFYAKEKGWLEPLNIKLLHVTSLSENLYLYQAGKSDAFVGTQYEYNILVKQKDSLIPVMLFDRSNGGDVIMSNVSVEELQKSEKTVDAYLEMDSVNNTLIKDFIKKYGLKNKTINYINRDQTQISILDAKNIKKPTIIATYIPYGIALQKQGFTNIASTKDNLDLLVVDALFTTKKVFQNHKNQFTALKKLVDDALAALEKNPKEFYETVNPYMLELSYEEFTNSLKDIIWINKKISAELERRMKESSFPSRHLI